MMSRSLAVGLLATGCLAAAAGGAYLSVQEHAAAATADTVSTAPAAVTETEAVVEPTAMAPTASPAPAPAVRVEERLIPVEPARPSATRVTRAARRTDPDVPRAAAPSPSADVIAPAVEQPARELPARDAGPVTAPAAVEDAPAASSAPRLEEVVLPASSVIGFEIETTLTSERARLEDRVEAHVARDVYADGRVVIPAGTRAIGIVSEVDRGGKVKERARLGVRFHTLVLADGRQLEIETDTIYREGDSPVSESSKKIGGAAIGGAVLGAIMGGKKGAVLGGAAGAAGGTAAVMAGGRNPATLTAGTVLTARLASPLTVEVERR